MSQLIQPLAVAAGLATLFGISFLVWSRERRMRRQRERLRKTYHLSEEILSASTPEAIYTRINTALVAILGVSRVHLYVYNRAAKSLDALTDGSDEAAVSISLSAPPGGTYAGAVACYHYRTLLAIPDIDRSPFPISRGSGEKAPKSLLFVPMLAQGEVVGILELDHAERAQDFTPDEQTLAQHLANQIGVAVRLLDQRSVQEQLYRTEKLAAVGRLISGVVNELQVPLSSISDLARRVHDKAHAWGAEREVATIAAEAQRAAAMVARLVSFAANEEMEARPVSVTALLHNLLQFREGDWKASGIRVRDFTTSEPLFVMGSQGQLEQVFLNLLVHAEQTLAGAPQKTITVRTSVLARRVLVEVAFTAPAVSDKPEEAAGVLGITRSVIAGHGGEVRLIEKHGEDPRFEIELPTTTPKERVPAGAAAGVVADFPRGLTALVIESEETAQRQILSLLAARGCRVIPVSSADTGLELANRMRFDAAFCSDHAPGLNWVELSERMVHRVGAFVLLSDGYRADLAADFEGDGCYVLAKPVQEAELDRLLRDLEPPIPVARNGAA
jgi:GAF domain-containing protein